MPRFTSGMSAMRNASPRRRDRCTHGFPGFKWQKWQRCICWMWWWGCGCINRRRQKCTLDQRGCHGGHGGQTERGLDRTDRVQLGYNVICRLWQITNQSPLRVPIEGSGTKMAATPTAWCGERRVGAIRILVFPCRLMRGALGCPVLVYWAPPN